MRIRGYELTYPRVLLMGLVVTLLITSLVGLSTSSTAFGSYNPTWEGTSDLRKLATSPGSTTEIEQSTASYQQKDPTTTTALILSPTEPYSTRDADRIDQFLARGGTVLLAADFNGTANGLLGQLNVTARFDGRLVRDERVYYRSPAFPVAEPVTNDTLVRSVSRLTLNHGTAITPGPNSTVLVNTSGYAYFDSNRNGGLDDSETLRQRPVVVQESYGNGTLILVSDPSVFINAMLDVPDNEQFARNVITRNEVVVFDYSHRRGIPWAVALVLTVAETPLLQFAVVAVLLGVAGALWYPERVTTVWQSMDSESVKAEPELTQAEITERITARHPDWDDSRVDRVATGIMSDGTKDGDDD